MSSFSCGMNGQRRRGLRKRMRETENKRKGFNQKRPQERELIPPPPIPCRCRRIRRLSSCSLLLTELYEEGVPLFGPYLSAFVLVEATSGAGLVQLYHERFHVVQLKVCLFFRLGIDPGKDLRVVKVNIALLTMFLVRRNSGQMPFSSTNVAFVLRHARFCLPRRFSYIGIIGVRLTVTLEFIYNLSRRKFDFVLPAEYILETWSWSKESRDTTFF